MIRLLFVGDIVGRPGRELIRRGLLALRELHRVDLTIANAENSAAGFGITREIGDELLERGVDVMTSGNHIWDKKEAIDYIGAEPRLLRPANFPDGVPGRGSYLARRAGDVPVGVVNVMGRVFMQNLDDPFAVVLKDIDALRARTKVIFVDFHAEATSEKIAMGWHLDGRVTAVVGTHTHVQTADERILPKGTAYLTDVGMTGPHDSVIGVEIEPALGRFLTGMPARFETATANPRLNAVLVEADEETGRALDIERLSYSLDELDAPAALTPMQSDLFDLPFEDDPEAAEAITPATERKDDADQPPQSAHRESHIANHRTQNPEPGTQNPEPGTRNQEPGTRHAPSHPATQPPRTIFSVTDLTVQVRDLLERGFSAIWVEGELSNCRLWNGHLYFTLKDDRAQLRGFMFKSSLRYLRFKPGDGLRVVARGRISVYEPKGEYQIQCEHLEPQGLGALQLAFEQLKKRLQAEGLFDAGRKRPLPALPRKIGIVTSLDGAAIRDIVKVLARRHPTAHLVVRPSRVQGEGAGAEVAHALRAVARVPGVDVIILARGGGSIEDLWAFNEESVARAIYHAPVPVVCGVGHESDVTIADFVADLRAPTPSAAAEMVVAAKDEFVGRIDRLAARAQAVVHARVQRAMRRVHLLDTRPAFAGIPARVAMRGRDAADLRHALARSMRSRVAAAERRLAVLGRQLDGFDLGRRLAGIRTRLVAAEGRLDAAIARRRHRADLQLRDRVARLDALSPLGVLGRGYAVAWNADRTRVLRDAREVAPGEHIRVTLARGELDCDVRDRTS